MGHFDWPINQKQFETLGMLCPLAPMLKSFCMNFSFFKKHYTYLCGFAHIYIMGRCKSFILHGVTLTLLRLSIYTYTAMNERFYIYI
jgi:hypothetical protein